MFGVSSDQHRKEGAEAGGAERRPGLRLLAAEAFDGVGCVVTDAVDGEGDDIGLANQARKQRRMVMPAPIMHQQHPASFGEQRPHLLNGAGAAAHIQHAPRWQG